MLLLMNSAMMPQDGIYTRKTITKQEFRRRFLQHKDNDRKSYIGYPNACKMLTQLLGEQIELNRDTCDLKQGDVILAITLKYRVNPDEKAGGAARQHGESVEDYNFIQISYNAE